MYNFCKIWLKGEIYYLEIWRRWYFVCCVVSWVLVVVVLFLCIDESNVWRDRMFELFY